VGDVATEAACTAIVADAATDGLDGVVCNVGIGRGGGLARTTADEWDMTLNVNLRSHFLVARAAVPVLEPGGAIVFIGSVAGLQPGSRLPAYDASKAGLIGLCRHVALEGARRDVRANVLAPGLIDTPLGRIASAGDRRASARRYPRPAGHRLGGRVGGDVPPVIGGELRDRPGAGGRRWPHPDLTHNCLQTSGPCGSRLRRTTGDGWQDRGVVDDYEQAANAARRDGRPAPRHRSGERTLGAMARAATSWSRCSGRCRRCSGSPTTPWSITAATSMGSNSCTTSTAVAINKVSGAAGARPVRRSAPRLLAAQADLLALQPGMSVLEIGTGPGTSPR
jgi:hypothetical protein